MADLKGRLLEGKLDIRIKYAGFGATSPLIEVDLSTAKRLYDVSVLDLLAVAQAFAPMLIKAKRKMVNINSVGDLNDAMERCVRDGSAAFCFLILTNISCHIVSK